MNTTLGPSPLGTPTIRLVPFGLVEAVNILAEPSWLQNELRLRYRPEVKEQLFEVLDRERAKPTVSGQWMSFMVVNESDHHIVGTCAFKTAPAEGGCVEIAYFIFPFYEGKGYATHAARKLIELAINTYKVNRVIARTLRERNASCRVLEKAGMRFVGDVMDPEDGLVWEWELLA